jgi:hypothetical protein
MICKAMRQLMQMRFRYPGVDITYDIVNIFATTTVKIFSILNKNTTIYAQTKNLLFKSIAICREMLVKSTKVFITTLDPISCFNFKIFAFLVFLGGRCKKFGTNPLDFESHL